MTSKPNLLVIVPYRDRAEHLGEFLPYIKTTLNAQKIPHEILIAEQGADKLFNRGLLCNAGFLTRADTADYICVHDVDMLGENFDYSYTEYVAHLSARERRRRYEEWYPDFLGGVTLFSTTAFKTINGFSNEYYGWGCEDDDLRLRCYTFNVPVTRRQGRYRTLPHPTMPHENRLRDSPNYDNNLRRLNEFRDTPHEARKTAASADGLTTTVTKTRQMSVEKKEDYWHVIVEL